MAPRQQVRQLLDRPIRLDRGIGHRPHPLGVEQGRRQQPRRRLLGQRRAGEQGVLAPARAVVKALVAAETDLGRQAGDQRAVQGGVGDRVHRLVGRRVRGLAAAPAQFVAQQLQLAVQLAPLAHAQEAEEMLLAPTAQLGLGEFLVGLLVGVPQFEDADELRARVGEQRMRVVGGGALVGRTLARILDAQERGDRDRLAQAAVLVGGHQHARQLHVHRQARHGPAGGGELALLVDRAEFGQLLPAVGDGAAVGRLQERERLDIAQAQRQHAQDHAGQRGAADFRVGVLRPRFEIGLAVQPVASAFADAAAAALALVGAGLADRFDVQPVELAARAVALDPGQARIDHVADARHRQRGFGDVGRQHDAALGAGVEHPVLVAHRQPRVQRQHFGLAVLAPLQRLVRVADLALPGQEDQHVAARILASDLVAGGDDAVVDAARSVRIARFGIRRSGAARRVGLVRALRFGIVQRAIAHVHRIAAALHADHRRAVEVRGEALGVDGRRGHDDLEVRALLQQLLEIAQQEIDVEAALVRLVDEDGVVGRQEAVGLDLRQQDAVGHELDRGALADVLVEAHLIADRAAEFGVQFLGHAPRHRARGDAARLGAADQAGGAAAGGQAQLGQLGGLARTGLAGDHHHRVLADQLDDALGFGRDRQSRIHRRLRQRRRARLALRQRRRQRLGERLLRGRIGGLAAPARPQPVQAAAVAAQRAVDGAARLP